jgi:hypothetical protein
VVSALLLVFGLAVAPAPVDCTHGVILLVTPQLRVSRRPKRTLSWLAQVNPNGSTSARTDGLSSSGLPSGKPSSAPAFGRGDAVPPVSRPGASARLEQAAGVHDRGPLGRFLRVVVAAGRPGGRGTNQIAT